MATVNTVKVTLQVRNDEAQDWLTRNPVLAQGEFALENDTFLMKIGDGVRDWEHLPYLNKFDSSYFSKTTAGDITLAPTFVEQINNLIAQAGGDAQIVITNDPTEPTDPVNLRYLEYAIAHAGHLKREVVESLPASDIDEDTLYMILATSGDHYDEYMYINGAWDVVGTTGDAAGTFVLEVATESRLGGVKASTNDDYINITQDGFMTLNKVSTSKLYVPTGDTLVIYGGTA